MLISNSLQKMVTKRLKFGKKMENSLFKHILLATFVTIAMVKLKLMPEFNIWVILLINQLDEIDERQHSVFGYRVGKFAP